MLDFRNLSAVMAAQRPDWHSDWAWDNYKDTLVALIRTYRLSRLCEIGGGRDPSFSAQEAAELGITLTINDISASELAKAPPGFATACFDIAGDLSHAGLAPEQFDLMFSRMVFEHVEDVRQAWRNIHMLLAPGGIALAFFPTLYALPFAANHIAPEWLSSAIVKTFYPNRGEAVDDPKFPAFYDWCFSSEDKIGPMLQECGFSDVAIQPFWGHGYFNRLPLARQLDDAFNAFAAKRDWRAMTAYAYVLVRK
ncbi:class I SAM-dependent methyltransferase [Chelatococcus sp. GCM10030263]|uniref:class I SAM-dependent methyltransferase n=1 Tax=Chelatococcus sp. GCM10030263 TaxID=3273387 RepID=UPI00360BCCD9